MLIVDVVFVVVGCFCAWCRCCVGVDAVVSVDVDVDVDLIVDVDVTVDVIFGVVDIVDVTFLAAKRLFSLGPSFLEGPQLMTWRNPDRSRTRRKWNIIAVFHAICANTKSLQRSRYDTMPSMVGTLRSM